MFSATDSERLLRSFYSCQQRQRQRWTSARGDCSTQETPTSNVSVQMSLPMVSQALQTNRQKLRRVANTAQVSTATHSNHLLKGPLSLADNFSKRKRSAKITPNDGCALLLKLYRVGHILILTAALKSSLRIQILYPSLVAALLLSTTASQTR